MNNTPTKRITLTGAAGSIGQCITPVLQERGWVVRGFDRVEAPLVDEMIIGDISDPATCAKAMSGADILIHLAAYPNPADFIEKIVEPNILGLHHVCEEARAAGVTRLIIASTVQVIQHFYHHDGPRPIRLEHGFAPSNYYSLSKAFAELYGEMLTRRHEELAVLSVRIGWFVRNMEEFARLEGKPGSHGFYLSHEDCKRFFIRAVEAEFTGYHCVFAVSHPPNQDAPLVDPDPAREVLGYTPQDTWPHGSPGISPE